jgi:hypothetical protein
MAGGSHSQMGKCSMVAAPLFFSEWKPGLPYEDAAEACRICDPGHWAGLFVPPFQGLAAVRDGVHGLRSRWSLRPWQHDSFGPQGLLLLEFWRFLRRSGVCLCDAMGLDAFASRSGPDLLRKLGNAVTVPLSRDSWVPAGISHSNLQKFSNTLHPLSCSR